MPHSPRPRWSAALRGAGALLTAAVGLACATAAPSAPPASPPSSPVATAPAAPAAPAGWTVTWRDEFDGAAGTAPDPARWVADTGGGGWGNQEREYYTTRRDNAALDGAGHLVITARAEPEATAPACWYGRCRYTSARLKTRGRFAQAYGRFEARLRIPRGQGIWPAFWMLGDDIDAAGWPRAGEIDVMENIGREPAVVHGTVHGPGYSGAASLGGADTLRTGALADDFHVYAVEWEPAELRFYRDGVLYRRTAPAGLPAGGRWVFDHPFFLLLNVAVGGAWPGDPDATSAFPQAMLVDYVRAYRRDTGS